MDQKTFNRIRLASIVLNEIEDLAPKMYPFLEFEKNEDGSDGKYRILPPVGEAKESHELLMMQYPKWSEEILELLKEYYPQKADDFEDAYKLALPFVTLECRPRMANSHKLKFEFIKYLTEQRIILSHLFSKVSSMEITDEEPVVDEYVETAFTDNAMRVFKTAVQPVLEDELGILKTELSGMEGNFKEIIDVANLIIDAASNDIGQLNNSCAILKKLCEERDECKGIIRPLNSVFAIIRRM